MGEIRFVGTGETRGYPYLVCKKMLYSQRHFFVSLFLCLFTGQSFPLILGVLIFVETTYRKLAGI